MPPSSAEERIATHEAHLAHISDDVKEIKALLYSQFVSKSEFEPVRNAVYGLIGILLTSVIGALAALVLKR